MPQIWMTYEELAALMHCDPNGARAKAAAIPLDRRRSHDGHTRAKLDTALSERFLDQVARQWIDREILSCADALRAVHDQMARAILPGSAGDSPEAADARDIA